MLVQKCFLSFEVKLSSRNGNCTLLLAIVVIIVYYNAKLLVIVEMKMQFL